MHSIAKELVNPYVLVYCISIVVVPLFYSQWHRRRRALVTQQRRTRGLPGDSLLSRPELLKTRRQHAFTEVSLLLLTVIGLPLVLSVAIPLIEESAASGTSGRLGLTISVGGVVFVLLWSAKSPLRAFVGGLAFKLLAVFAVPFEIGDRVTVKGTTGRVIRLNTFLLELETTEGERVSLPSHLLWNEMVAIAPERAIRCEEMLQLSLKISSSQRHSIEAFLREAVQSSTYLAPSKPIQVYLSMESSRLQITVIAYVTSREYEMAFKSEITSAFLLFAEREKIVL